MEVFIGKGITLSVDTDTMPQAAMAHVVMLGLKNILQDTHAGESDPDLARALAEKKLAMLMNGEVRTVSGREGDPVKARAKLIAANHVKATWRKAGNKPSALTTDMLNTGIATFLTKNPQTFDVARNAIAAEKAIGEVEV